MRILLVEDNLPMAMNIVEYLSDEGHEVDHAADGQSGLRLAESAGYEVVLLDVSLPRLGGLDVCRRVASGGTSRPGILMLTARDTLEDKLAGFRAGADDYLVKPFDLAELGARVGALSRRSGDSHADEARRLHLHDIEVDRVQRLATCRGEELVLTRIQYRILEELVGGSPERVMTDTLLRVIWGEFPPAAGVLRTHIAALRRTLREAGAQVRIETIHGQGFRMRPNDG